MCCTGCGNCILTSQFRRGTLISNAANRSGDRVLVVAETCEIVAAVRRLESVCDAGLL